ncbi:DUF6571 family protein [Streptomyces sp. GC420]|uniref:DUF6571 family protein n=1 Tax=Streptomyces sp. GC420 TaxID=2697568 RepID=UPI0014150F16|nr:DUF6571 family protein [Streptomyces sp. GC420]NBM17667.1 hypothetical protein [Streptomyces sp. GC420]
MLSFDDVYHAPLGPLRTAIGDWSKMTTDLERLAGTARDGMLAKSEKAAWKGVNSDVTRPFIRKTAKEFDDAAKEAKGVRQILEDGHLAFKKAQDDLRRIVEEDAPAQGLKVDGKGRVSAVDPLEDHATEYRNDPDYPELLRRQNSAIARLQRRIDRVVEDCSDADDSLRRALTANVKDDHDFGGPKYRTLDEEQVDRAAKLVDKVTGPGGTARNVEELRQLEELLDDNRSDPEFATGFYRRLGAEGALEAYTRMSLDATGLGPIGQDRADMVRNIQKDMGNMLGLATDSSTPGHLDKAWTNDLLKAGRKQIDVSDFAGLGTQVYGYQALGALLREGDYDKEFLTSVGRDMVAMDRENPKVWEQNLPFSTGMAFSQDEGGGKGFNPLTGLLEALAANPEASTALFHESVREDSNGDGIVTEDDRKTKGPYGKAQGMVDYFLDKKPEFDWYDTSGTSEPGVGQNALGRALEAAVTQRVPGDDGAEPVKHTRAMADVMERVVAKIGENPELVTAKPGEDPAPLSGIAQNLGNMAAEYMPDLQATAENGAQQAKYFGEPAKFDKGDMTGFLGAVAQDPGAYGAIKNAQQAYTTLLVYDVFTNPTDHGDPGDAVRNAVHPGGEIAGIMTEARAQAVHDTHAYEDGEFNKGVEEQAKWTNRVISLAGAKYLEMAPIAGDVVGWLQEDITASVVENASNDSTDEARREAGEGYQKSEFAARTSAEAAVVAAARGSDLSEAEIREYAGAASTQAAAAHSIGRDFVASTNSKGN